MIQEGDISFQKFFFSPQCHRRVILRVLIWVWTPPVLVVVIKLVFIVAQMDLQQAYLVMRAALWLSVSVVSVKASVRTIWLCST